MKKAHAILLAICIALSMAALCYFTLFEFQDLDCDKSTNPTQAPTTPTITEPLQTEPTPPAPAETDPTEDIQNDLLLYTFSQIKPSHTQCDDIGAIQNQFPNCDVNGSWWNNHYYYLPSSILELEDYSNIDSINAELLKTWDEFKTTKTSNLLNFMEEGAFLIADSEEITATSLSSVLINDNSDKTIEQAIQEGYWVYATAELSEERINKLFGQAEIQTAEQIVNVWGAPSEAYYAFIAKGIAIYLLDYDFGDYSILIAGYEKASNVEYDMDYIIVIDVYGKQHYDIKEQAFEAVRRVE